MERVLKHNVGDDVLIVIRGHIKNISIVSSDDCCYVVEVDDPATRQDKYKDLLYFSEKDLEDHEYIEALSIWENLETLIDTLDRNRKE